MRQVVLRGCCHFVFIHPLLGDHQQALPVVHHLFIVDCAQKLQPGELSALVDFLYYLLQEFNADQW